MYEGHSVRPCVSDLYRYIDELADFAALVHSPEVNAYLPYNKAGPGERRFRVYGEAPHSRLCPPERGGDAYACIWRYQAFALLPVRERRAASAAGAVWLSLIPLT